jgi:prolyl-tRNA editing enzyme YbaK/EbsC (Cys-tRNA(Pro) deacylase)
MAQRDAQGGIGSVASDKLSRSAERVQQALDAAGIALQVEELSASTRTAQDAASAIGCEVGQIAKSLIFAGAESDEPILIVASGSNRVDVVKTATTIGEPLAKANADFVLQQTGYAIGGVPPVGHSKPIATYIDKDLLQYNVIWAAAGTPWAVFALTPSQLLELTHAKVIAVT